MQELLEKINSEIAGFQKDAAAQIEKGNKTAGVRARKAALAIINDMKAFRKASVEAAKDTK